MSDQDYLQPDFYRFNEDSLILVRTILGKIDSVDSILDLGAGCGVLGLELALHYKPRFLGLVELQKDFQESLESNIERFLPSETRLTLEYKSFSQWAPHRKFDLIVCNPPYYLPQHGQKSDDQRRHKARCFEEDDWATLASAIKKSLSSDGIGFIVLKNDPQILKAARSALSGIFNCQEDIQGGLVILELS